MAPAWKSSDFPPLGPPSVPRGGGSHTGGGSGSTGISGGWPRLGGHVSGGSPGVLRGYTGGGGPMGGGSNVGGGSPLGLRGNTGGGGPRGAGGNFGGRKSNTNMNMNMNSPYEKMVEKFDELEVIEESKEMIKNEYNNSGNVSMINFDAYEDIPVETSGKDVPIAVSTFDEISDLGEALKENIRRCKYVKPTPIQRHAIPIAMAGRDLMACAQTGSGKTAAFCFPIIAGIMSRRRSQFHFAGGGSRSVACPTALILAPTRELSMQIHEEAKKFAFETGVKVVVAYGGAPIHDQFRILARGVDILVATPGRLVDMIERGRVSLRMIRYLALDEADRMLDMGFEPQIRKIVQNTDMPTPGARQTLLFSATFPTEIQRLASDFLSNYIFLTVGKVGSSTDLIAQKVDYVDDFDKKRHLMNILVSQKINEPNVKHLTIVFVETKRGADGLENWLSRNGQPAVAIHGDKVQMERERALKSFKSGATPIMVATDVAARGLDIPCVAHVINYDLPRDIDNYVHRIGRTGRAGKSGLATAFFNDKNIPIAKALAELMEEANQEVPPWLSQYAKTSSSYGQGSGNQSRGGRFGGRDYRNFDDCANAFSDSSSPYTGGVSSAEPFYTNPTANAADPYPRPAYGFAVGAANPYPTPAYGFTVEAACPYPTPPYFNVEAADPYPAPTHDFNVEASNPYPTPKYGYESIVASGWD